MLQHLDIIIQIAIGTKLHMNLINKELKMKLNKWSKKKIIKNTESILTQIEYHNNLYYNLRLTQKLVMPEYDELILTSLSRSSKR